MSRDGPDKARRTLRAWGDPVRASRLEQQDSAQKGRGDPHSRVKRRTRGSVKYWQTPGSLPRGTVAVPAWPHVYCVRPPALAVGRGRECAQACVEMPPQCGSGAEPGSLTSEVAEASRQKPAAPQSESIRGNTAGVMHYLSLCNKQMPLWMLGLICHAALLHWWSPKTASEWKGRILWSISCHSIGKDGCSVCGWLSREVLASLPAPSVLLCIHSKPCFFPPTRK